MRGAKKVYLLSHLFLIMQDVNFWETIIRSIERGFSSRL